MEIGLSSTRVRSALSSYLGQGGSPAPAISWPPGRCAGRVAAQFVTAAVMRLQRSSKPVSVACTMPVRRLAAALAVVIGLSLAPGSSKALAGVHAAIHVYDVSFLPFPLALDVARGDFNGDGRLDLATSALGMSGSDATVLFGRGDGTFADGELYETDRRPGAIAVGDLDGDGRSDMVLPSEESANSMTLLYGNADSTFDIDAIDLGVRSFSVGVGHFDAGPALDIAAAVPGGVMLLLGENGFDEGIEYSTGGGGYLVGAGDFNGDGRDDVVAYPGPGSITVAVLLSNPDGTLQAPRATPLGYMQSGLAVGRVNADARSDVVLAPSASLALAGVDGTLGAFVPLVAGGVLSATVSAALGDFNADTMTDVALSAPYNAVGEVKLLAGRGDGTFSAPISFAAPDRTAAELLTDLNADGFGDLVITDAQNGRVIVALNAPAVAATPSGLGYGSVIVGNVGAAQTLTITNDGLPPLAINRLALGGAHPGDFRLVADACTGACSPPAPAAPCRSPALRSPAARGRRISRSSATRPRRTWPSMASASCRRRRPPPLTAARRRSG